MTETCPAHFVTLAQRLADAGAAVIRRYYRTRITVDDKADLSPVTAADREAERIIRTIIAQQRPDDGIIGEEMGIVAPDAEWVWVIDPIDGTKSFIAGRPLFGILIGLLHRGIPTLGLIDQPITNDRWIGAVGRPTTHNHHPARTREPPAGLASAMVGTTAPELLPGGDWTAFQRVASQAKMTIYGGDCVNYGLVASGFLDVVIESGLKLYDFCALVPVVIGAGGLMTDWEGRPLDARSTGKVVACGDAGVHAEILRQLNGNS